MIINLTRQDDQQIPWNFKDNLRGGERETEDGLLSGARSRVNVARDHSVVSSLACVQGT